MTIELFYDELDGKKVLGFDWHDYYIIDPFSSACGRFPVNPKLEYGLNDNQIKRLNDENNLNENINDYKHLDKNDFIPSENLGENK